MLSPEKERAPRIVICEDAPGIPLEGLISRPETLPCNAPARLELEAWAAWHEVCKEKYREDYVAESDDSEELQAITRSSHRSFRALLKHDSASVEDARKLESKLGDSWDFEETTGGDGTR